MNFKTLTGATRRVSKPKKYLIKWKHKSKSKIQFRVKEFLEPYWGDHIVFEEFPVAGSRLTFDFYNANKKIAVEVQGAQHLKYVPFFHGPSRSKFLQQIRRDQDKVEFCKLNNITFVEIFPDDEISRSIFESQGVFL
tara:strand:- start:1230 stop:1640 length:411 start_codon:yes stop_codon:yes gene_type:complete